MPPVEQATETQLILTEIAEIKVSVKNIDEAIRGNGEEGLKPRVKNLERRWSFVSKFLWVVMIAVIGVLVKLVFTP